MGGSWKEADQDERRNNRPVQRHFADSLDRPKPSSMFPAKSFIEMSQTPRAFEFQDSR
jgi:hypothetical protein